MINTNFKKVVELPTLSNRFNTVSFIGQKIQINIGNKGDVFEKSQPDNQELDKLKELVRKLKNRYDPITKKKLQELERKMLEQELQYPEKYLERVKSMTGHSNFPDDYQEQIAEVRLKALIGLITYFINLEKMEKEYSFDQDFYCKMFNQIIDKTPDNSYKAESIKNFAIYTSKALYKHMNEPNKRKIEHIALSVLKESPFERCKTAALSLFAKEVDKSNPVIKLLQKDYYDIWLKPETSIQDKNQALVILGKLDFPELENIIPKVIKNDEPNINFDTRLIAVWAAGRIKTNENFKLLTSLINTNIKKQPEHLSDEELQLSEMALVSIAEHYDKTPEKVISILDKVTETNSSLSEIAVALKEKVEEQYKKEDYFIKKELTSQQEIETYKQQREDYTKGLELLNTEKKNLLDVGLLPFRKFLDFFKFINSQIVIAPETVSDVAEDYLGKRYEDGRYADHDTGLAIEKDNKKLAIVGLSDFSKPFHNGSNTSGHEMSHHFLFNLKKFDKDEYSCLEKLYEDATKENRFIDDYAASNIDEYWAVGYETYLQAYKSHNHMIDFTERQSSSYATRATLRRKDPRLVEFIERMVKKYGQSDIGVQKAKKAYLENKNRTFKITVNFA